MCKSCMEMSPLSRSPCFDPFASPLVLSIFVFLSCHSSVSSTPVCSSNSLAEQSLQSGRDGVNCLFKGIAVFSSRFSERNVVLLLISVVRSVFVAVLCIKQIRRSFLFSPVLRITRNFSCPQLVFVRSRTPLILTYNILWSLVPS